MSGGRKLQDEALSFRLDHGAATNVKRCASEAGVTVAAYLRGVVAEHLRKVVPPENPELWEKDTPMRRAAMGDLAAQRYLVADSLMVAHQVPGEEFGVAMADAEFWAKAAAANGEHADRVMLVHLLGTLVDCAELAGDLGTKRRKLAELMAYLAVFADAGDEDTARALNNISNLADGGVAASAKALVAMWEAVE